MRYNYLKDQLCSQFINSLSDDLRKRQKVEVNKVRILSFLSDGSTNAGILKEEAVYVGNILHGGAMTQFASVENLNKSDAVGILKVINEVLLGLESSDTLNDEEYLNNVYAKLVNSNFDGGSVMNESVSGGANENERKTKWFNLYALYSPSIKADSEIFDQI